jgi:CRP-like cAMP-binding protein
MAEVFLARSRVGGIEKRCVIKRVLPRYSTSRPFVSMFIDEARITIGLDHENLVRLFDFGQVEGSYFMALEYVEGCDLVDVLRAHKAQGRGVPPLVAAYIARCVLRGLHHAHALTDPQGRPLGVVHRDVSPQNVFLSWAGDVKIGDFGIAVAKNKLSRTMHGTVKGKFSYMSPEQASGDELDGRSDVFSVGVVLWESLVGGRLFAADNPVDTMGRVLEAPVLPPSELRPNVPKELDAVVLKALQRSLLNRTASAAQMADELDAILSAHHFNITQLTDMLAALRPTLGPDARDRGAAQPPPADGATVALPDDAKLRGLHLELRKEKNLWTLVDIAERHAKLGAAEDARAAVRTAACVLAHRGLVVPAICALHSLRELLSEAEFLDDLRGLAALRVHDRAELKKALLRIGDRGFFQHIQDADPDGLGRETTDASRAIVPSPLFANLNPNDFARFAAAATLDDRRQGTLLVEEGEPGDCLYAVGRGRVVVYTRPTDDLQKARADRVYVAALSEGDFFGEFSLLTRSPRSATVEALTNVVLLKIDRRALAVVSGGEARFRGPLVEFYKERVAELLLARSPMLGALPQRARQNLLASSGVYRFKDSAMIVKEGDLDRSVFLVMSGEVEVFHLEDGFPVFIDKLRDGQIFGERGGLTGDKRSASVRAIGDVEILLLDGPTLAEVLREHPDVQERLSETIEQRERDAKERIEETVRVFSGV